jgi:hypothetical protein
MAEGCSKFILTVLDGGAEGWGERVGAYRRCIGATLALRNLALRVVPNKSRTNGIPYVLTHLMALFLQHNESICSVQGQRGWRFRKPD